MIQIPAIISERWWVKLKGIVLIVALLYLATAIGQIAVRLWVARYTFDCFPSNGCFQLYNPLRRLFDGQPYGIDFAYFYGPGALWFQAIFYKLFGGNLWASEVAHQVAPFSAFMAAAVFLGRQIWRRWDYSVIFSAFLLCAAQRFGDGVVAAGNSPTGLQVALPLFMAGLIWRYTADEHRLTSPKAIAIGITGGAALFVGLHHGLAALIAWLFCLAFLKDKSRLLAIILWSLLAFTVTTYLLWSGLGGGLAALAYHFQIQPGDQIWYFGAPPASFLESWYSRGVVLLFRQILPDLLILAGLFTWRRRLDSHAPFMAYLPVYGLVSALPIIAINRDHYLIQAKLAMVIVIAALIMPRKSREHTTNSLANEKMTIFGVALAMLLMIGSAADNIQVAGQALPVKPNRANAGVTLGVTLNDSWSQQLHKIRDVLTPGCHDCLWSVYAGLPEAEMGIFHPSTDYIIHAFGPIQREAYVEKFKMTNPLLVRTMPADFAYNPWMWQENWPFFCRVFENYEFTYQDERGALWQRNKLAWREPENPTREAKVMAGAAIQLPRDPQDAVYDLLVSYKISNPWKWLPIVGNSERLLLYPRGGNGNAYPISLATNTDVFRTMTIVKGGDESSSLELNVRGLLPGVKVTIVSVKYDKLQLSPENLHHVMVSSRISTVH